MRIKIASITPESPAEVSGLRCGDEVALVDGIRPRDVLDYARLAAGADAEAELGDGRTVPAAALTGAVLDDAVFDGVQTCDNHCEFCFIFQLPKGMRRSLYLKDDDYRLSALYGNFTTLTRFTEADLERVITERISPLHVSIHTTDPALRAEMLRNPKGAMSLRWLRALLDAGIEVHGQIVLCPGTNDGERLDETIADLVAGYGELASVGIVPLGVSRFSNETGLRVPTSADAAAILESVDLWQKVALERFGRRFVYASDEVYLLAGHDFPPADDYDGFLQHENGIGMASALESELTPKPGRAHGAPAWGYRPDRGEDANAPRHAERVAIVTGALGAPVIAPLVDRFEPAARGGVEILAVDNDFFGGNIGVTGLLCGADMAAAIARLAPGTEAVIPDVVFNEGRTLDEHTPADIAAASGHDVRVVTTDADGLRAAVTC